MPRLNRLTGQVAAGVGDSIVSLDRNVVGYGGGAYPVDGGVVYGGRLTPTSPWQTLRYDAASGKTDVINVMAAQQVVGSGPSWAAVGPGGYVGTYAMPSDTFLSLAATDGRGAGDGYGTIAVTGLSGQGFALVNAKGVQATGAPGFAAYGLTVVGPTQAIWPDQRGGFATLNLPVPKSQKVSGRACWCVVNGRTWIVYWSDGLGLIAHSTDDASRGVVLETAGLNFHYDAMPWGDRLRVCWSVSASERPDEIICFDQDLSALSPFHPVTPIPPEPPEPTPIPPEPPDPKPPIPPKPEPVPPLRRHRRV